MWLRKERPIKRESLLSTAAMIRDAADVPHRKQKARKCWGQKSSCFSFACRYLYTCWKITFAFCAVPKACYCCAVTSAGGSQRTIHCSPVVFILAQCPPRRSGKRKPASSPSSPWQQTSSSLEPNLTPSSLLPCRDSSLAPHVTLRVNTEFRLYGYQVLKQHRERSSSTYTERHKCEHSIMKNQTEWWWEKTAKDLRIVDSDINKYY